MKVALVTGGTKGIGKAIALAYLQAGYEVILNYDKDDRSAYATQEEFNMLGYCPVLIRADVSNQEQVKRMFDEVFENYEHLDILVNNAGIDLYAMLQDMSEEEWDRIMDVNVKGMFLCCKQVIRKMVGNNGGCIINISSIWGEVGASCEVAYSASKGAIIAFTKALAKELAPSNIRVNCVAPGFIDTAMNSGFTEEEMEDIIARIPLGRTGKGEDVAKACLYLAEADYVTGETLSVGGAFAK